MHDFSFKNTKFSASQRTHSPQTPLCVCKRAIDLDAPPTHPPNVEDGCPSVCSFGVIAVVKCLVDKL